MSAFKKLQFFMSTLLSVNITCNTVVIHFSDDHLYGGGTSAPHDNFNFSTNKSASVTTVFLYVEFKNSEYSVGFIHCQLL